MLLVALLVLSEAPASPPATPTRPTRRAPGAAPGSVASASLDLVSRTVSGSPGTRNGSVGDARSSEARDHRRLRCLQQLHQARLDSSPRWSRRTAMSTRWRRPGMFFTSEPGGVGVREGELEEQRGAGESGAATVPRMEESRCRARPWSPGPGGGHDGRGSSSALNVFDEMRSQTWWLRSESPAGEQGHHDAWGTQAAAAAGAATTTMVPPYLTTSEPHDNEHMMPESGMARPAAPRRGRPSPNNTSSSGSDDVDETESFGWLALTRRRYDDGGDGDCAGDRELQGAAMVMDPSLEMRLGRQGWEQMEPSASASKELTPILKCL
ncbi:uncharacterized protein LOC119299401 isoform X2 [Triticum dicoccoides]|uniref:uncharacterized protein LOC119299401 isoform X2 n=1 Tax=Triticum dicoccoides TaxID=85692 RepID=UPI00188E2718|nr:uncharacterized protein LOC119299401 isoform X2 [Triticum dicoccoides]